VRGRPHEQALAGHVPPIVCEVHQEQVAATG
jgi:hypothetical protein